MAEMSGGADLTYALQALKELRRAFVEGLPESLDEMEELALRLPDNGAFAENFAEFYRKTHSLKGSGGTHGLPVITTVCHQLEDYLDPVAGDAAKVPPGFVNNCLAYVDLLRDAVVLLEQGADSFPGIEGKLAALRERLFAKKYTALLVEPSRLSASLCLEVLRDFPFHTTVMDDGYRALERLLTEPFDLLITSLEVPLLNGVALIGAVRLSDSVNRNVKTILLTSRTDLPREAMPDFVLAKDTRILRNLGPALEAVMAELGPPGI